MKRIIKSLFSVSLPFMFLFLLSNCANKDKEYVDPRRVTYAGSESCLDCHPKIYNEALKSSHYWASAAASVKNVLGDFSSGHNTYIYDKDTKIVMENDE